MFWSILFLVLFFLWPVSVAFYFGIIFLRELFGKNTGRGEGASNNCDQFPHDNAQSPKTEADCAQEQEQGSWHD